MINDLLSGGNPFSGIRIFENPNCLEETETPIREHKRKPWMTENYHNRIQKKWIKRWGFEMRPVMYQTPQGFICHPTLAARLRQDNLLLSNA